jgi:hypothetical protein
MTAFALCSLPQSGVLGQKICSQSRSTIRCSHDHLETSQALRQQTPMLPHWPLISSHQPLNSIVMQ